MKFVEVVYVAGGLTPGQIIDECLVVGIRNGTRVENRRFGELQVGEVSRPVEHVGGCECRRIHRQNLLHPAAIQGRILSHHKAVLV